MSEPRTHAEALGNAAKRLYDSHQAARDVSEQIAKQRAEEAEKAAQEKPPEGTEAPGR